MKKTILAFLLAVVAFGSYCGYKYYDNQHKSIPYYVNVAQTPTETRQTSDTGKDLGMRYSYQFVAKDIDGHPRELDTIKFKQPITEGTWLKITASKVLVNSVEAISAREVPTQAK